MNETMLNETISVTVRPKVKAGMTRDLIYECEVKRRRVRAAGGYEFFWKTKTIVEALIDEDTEYRCKECGGAVKVFKMRGENGQPSHAEHKLKSDSEYCSAGMYFRVATDGRLPRRSEHPVR